MTQEDTAKSYIPGTIVFAKLKGYPWWPARIESDQQVPEKVLKKKARKKAALYNVYFYGSKDYGFFGPDAIRPFNPVHVQGDLDANKFRTRDLEIAIRQALNIDEFPSGHKRKASDEIIVKKKNKKPMVISEDIHVKYKGSPEYRKIYHLRHKLQQLAYNKKKGEIPIDDYVKILGVIKEIEKVDMTYVYLRDSKISKVVKAARFYPFETQVEIKERCQELMRSWKYKFIELHSDTIDY